jgi:glutathione S-transferase
MSDYPVLYSLQHCPFAMRARMAVLLAQYPVWLRAIVLKNKPAEMLAVSPTETVPLLVFEDDSIIDESLDIMLWLLKQNDPCNLLLSDNTELNQEMMALIELFDSEFKTCLEQYKSAKRYHDSSKEQHKASCERYVQLIEARLAEHDFIMGQSPSLVDYAILPFIRQFAKVDRKWYLQSPYPKLQAWLKHHLESALFSKTMTKYPLWTDEHESFLIGTA